MSVVSALRVAICLSALAFCPRAWADTFAIDYANQPPGEPDTSFDVDCGGAAEDESADCAERAAALHAELVDLLAGLSGESDVETLALFESVAAMNDPRLREIALRYFAHQQPPAGLWEKAREFFFGPDPVVGHPSAELLALSREDVDKQLSKAYLAGRPEPTHGGDFPVGSGLEDSWALGVSRDALLDELASFPEDERFPGATRLLMLDRFVLDSLMDAEPVVPVTAFVTGSSLSELEAHFTSLFGAAPYPALAEREAREEAIAQEFADLASNFSDPAAATRFQELAQELQDAQTAALMASWLGLDSEQYADHVFWINVPPGDISTGPLPRAVTVGTDPRLEGNVIAYVNGATSGAVVSAGGAASGDPDPNASGGAGAEPSAAGKHDSSGCGCSTSARGSAASALWALAALGVALQRQARSRRRNPQGAGGRSGASIGA